MIFPLDEWSALVISFSFLSLCLCWLVWWRKWGYYPRDSDWATLWRRKLGMGSSHRSGSRLLCSDYVGSKEREIDEETLSSIYLAFVFLILYLSANLLSDWIYAPLIVTIWINLQALAWWEPLWWQAFDTWFQKQTFFLAYALIASLGLLGEIYIYQAKKNTRKLSFLSTMSWW